MADEIIDDARLEAAQLIEQGEGPRRKLIGPVAGLTSCAAVAMSLIQLYWAWATVTAQILRLVFLGFSLVLTFLIYPARRRQRHVSVSWQDWLLIFASLAVIVYPLSDFEEFIYRAAIHAGIDQTFGALTILLVLEASRRTTGSILPTVAVMTLEGIFGVPLDVTVTFIISSRSMVPCWNIQRPGSSMSTFLCQRPAVSRRRDAR